LDEINKQKILKDFKRNSFPNSVNSLKASQSLFILIFYSEVFKNFCNSKIYNLLDKLVIITKLTLKKNLKKEKLENLIDKILNFLKEYKLVMGEEKSNMIYHTMIHIPFAIAKHGTFNNWSNFKFENLNGILLKNCFSNNNCENIIFNTFNNYLNIYQFLKFNSDMIPSYFYQIFKKKKIKYSSKKFFYEGKYFTKINSNSKYNSYTISIKNFDKNTNVFEILEIKKNQIIKIINYYSKITKEIKITEIKNQLLPIKIENSILFKKVIFPPLTIC